MWWKEGEGGFCGEFVSSSCEVIDWWGGFGWNFEEGKFDEEVKEVLKGKSLTFHLEIKLWVILRS